MIPSLVPFGAQLGAYPGLAVAMVFAGGVMTANQSAEMQKAYMERQQLGGAFVVDEQDIDAAVQKAMHR
ncbi:MAG: hypothetical protein M3Z05_09980 [Gemmatimonadota bacterium]|nr:hypothetical protein [Gemmatimonadota bacterium]